MTFVEGVLVRPATQLMISECGHNYMRGGLWRGGPYKKETTVIKSTHLLNIRGHSSVM